MTAPAWRASSHSALVARGACVQMVQVTRVDLRDMDLTTVRAYLTETHQLSAELARLVAAHNGVPSMLDREDPFLEVVRALPGSHRYAPRSTTALLGNDPRRLLDGRGLRIPLPPTSGGRPQSVTVTLNASAELAGSGFARERVDARYELRYTVGDRSEVRRDVREVTVSRGLGLRKQSASAAGKRPADAQVPRWGVPAAPDVRPPASSADGRAPDSLWTTPSRDRPPALEPRLRNDLTAMAKLALEKYLPTSPADAGTSAAPGSASPPDPRRLEELRRSLDPARVEDLYAALPDWMRNAPVADVADRIAQAHANKGEPVIHLGAGYGLENDVTGESLRAGATPGAPRAGLPPSDQPSGRVAFTARKKQNRRAVFISGRVKTPSITPHTLTSQVSEASSMAARSLKDTPWARRSPQQQRWERLRALARLLYGDKEGMISRSQDWPVIQDWKLLRDMVEGLGQNAAALVTVGPLTNITHALAIVHTTDGLRVADLDDAEGGVVNAGVAPPASVRAAFGPGDGRAVVRVLFVTPGGQALTVPTPARSGWSREQLDFRYGPAIAPRRVYGIEKDDTDDVRLNPFWYRLEDFPRQLLVEYPEVTWLYAVDEDGQIRIGTEYAQAVLGRNKWEKLAGGMSSAGQPPGRIQDRLGHPTIAAAFTKDGKALSGPARVAGELRWNAQGNGGRGRWEVNGDSGRYMGHRSDQSQNDVTRWLSSVADDLAEHFDLEFTPRRLQDDRDNPPRGHFAWWWNALKPVADSLGFTPEQLFAVANYGRFDISSELNDLVRFLRHEHEEPIGRLSYGDIVELDFQIDGFVQAWREYEQSRARRVASQLLTDELESLFRGSAGGSRVISERAIDDLTNRLLQMSGVLDVLHHDDYIKVIYGTPRIMVSARAAARDIAAEDWRNWPERKERSGPTSSSSPRTKPADGASVTPGMPAPVPDGERPQVPPNRVPEGRRGRAVGRDALPPAAVENRSEAQYRALPGTEPAIGREAPPLPPRGPRRRDALPPPMPTPSVPLPPAPVENRSEAQYRALPGTEPAIGREAPPLPPRGPRRRDADYAQQRANTLPAAEGRQPQPRSMSGPADYGRSAGTDAQRRLGANGRAGLRVDDPMVLGWPVGHNIVLDVTQRGSVWDQERRMPGDRRPWPDIDEVTLTADVPASRGKAQALPRTFERAFGSARGRTQPSGSRSFSYTVAPTGRIILPDGLEVPADGWVRHGADFLHLSEHLVLFGDSGWIGRVENWAELSESLAVETLPAYRVRTDATAFYLTPADGDGPSARIGSFTGSQTTPSTRVERPATSGRDLGGLTAFLDEPREAAGDGGADASPRGDQTAPVPVGTPATGSMAEALSAADWQESSHSDGAACVSVAVVLLGPEAGRSRDGVGRPPRQPRPTFAARPVICDDRPRRNGSGHSACAERPPGYAASGARVTSKARWNVTFSGRAASTRRVHSSVSISASGVSAPIATPSAPAALAVSMSRSITSVSTGCR
jgi:hypothetical protein